ncbi:MAG: hypothetical protein V4629_13760 [Pseudomonadota bacterium]
MPDNLQLDDSGSIQYQPLLTKIILQAPKSINDLDIDILLVENLIIKHIHHNRYLSFHEICQQVGLCGPICESIIEILREKQIVESTLDAMGGRVFRLTKKGITNAAEIRERCTYLGPAPISIKQYSQLVKQQKKIFTKDSLQNITSHLLSLDLESDVIESIGPGIISRRPLLIYGAAGTGKSYLCKAIAGILGDTCDIPYAIAVGRSILPLYNPTIHKQESSKNSSDEILLNQLKDRRLIRIKRPVIIVGGELELSAFEVRRDSETEQFHAPLQVLANSGVLVIDDLGRQKISVEQIFNRWILPLEEQEDNFSMGQNGQKFTIPLDMQLVFSTNLNPSDIADPAFLRRIGYKIRLGDLSEQQFKAIYRKEMSKIAIDFDPDIEDLLVKKLYPNYGMRMRATHPRDLLRIAQDYAQFSECDSRVQIKHMIKAWKSYFMTDAE